MNDFGIIGFDSPDMGSRKHYENTNNLSVEESEAYKLSSEKFTKTDIYLNPFKKEYQVILANVMSSRYRFAINLKEGSVAKVSAILNRDYVNIAYWDTFPNVIKNVPISHLSLFIGSPIKHKIKVFLTKLVRKILRIK